MGKSTRIVFVGIVLIGAIGLGIKVATSNSSPRKMEDLPWGQIEFVSGNRLQTTGKTAEIEGVCEILPGDSQCWNVDGLLDWPLGKELDTYLAKTNKQLKHQASGLNHDKTRVVIVKTRTLGKPGPGNPNYQYFDTLLTINPYEPRYPDTPYRIGGVLPTTPPKNPADQISEERKVVVGTFPDSELETSIDYAIEARNPVVHPTIPLKLGKFTIEGNTYEITAITKTPKGHKIWSNRGQIWYPDTDTYVTFKEIEITNPALVTDLMPADADGHEFYSADSKGILRDKAGAESAYQRWIKANPKRTPSMSAASQELVGDIYLNPYPSEVHARREDSISFGIPGDISAVKTLTIKTRKRVIFRFKGVPLGPKEFPA